MKATTQAEMQSFRFSGKAPAGGVEYSRFWLPYPE